MNVENYSSKWILHCACECVEDSAVSMVCSVQTLAQTHTPNKLNWCAGNAPGWD